MRPYEEEGALWAAYLRMAAAQDTSAHTARCKLQPFLQDAAGRLVRPETREHAALACPLAAPHATPQIPLSCGAFTGEYWLSLSTWTFSVVVGV
jgi:hypothetical protein